MRISKALLGIVSSLVIAGAAHAAQPTFTSAKDALKQGLSAYQGGYYELAIPALEFAAKEREFMAEYYLARIYSDNSGTRTDHAKAYELFKKIVDEHVDADPDNDPRAPYVGKSLTALAGYYRSGLPEIGLKPSLEEAVIRLWNASSTFNDEDAQFELAKLQLKGEGVESNIPLARHWLSVLSRNGHAGAQAFYADLLWRGSYVAAEPARALALIAIAVENAPPHDRLWIEDIYQSIFCGAGDGTRKQATGIVASWGKRFDRKVDRTEADFSQLSGPVRVCRNGEVVGPIPGASEVTPTSVEARQGDTKFMYGTSAGPPAASRPVDLLMPQPPVR